MEILVLEEGARRGRVAPECGAPCQAPLGRPSGMKGTDETEWLLSKPVLLAGVTPESRCGLLSGGTNRRYSYRGFTTGRRYPYEGGHPSRLVSYGGVMLPDPRGW